MQESYGLITVIVTLHAFTLLAYIVLARKIYHGVDIEHPVFAVIFQEAIFVPLLEAIGVSVLLFGACLKSEMAVMIYIIIGRASWTFHPVTWVMVSYLRYGLLGTGLFFFIG